MEVLLFERVRYLGFGYEGKESKTRLRLIGLLTQQASGLRWKFRFLFREKLEYCMVDCK